MKIRNYINKVLGLAVVTAMCMGSVSGYADTNMNLTAEPNNEGNYVHLEWNPLGTAKEYSYMIYSKEASESQFQSIPSKKNVKVLNIYPGSGNNCKTWMETNGYGKGLISVDAVDIGSFNSNPNGYLRDSNGNWKYDVIYVGAWDSNGHTDFNGAAVGIVEQFIKDGRGFLAGHDLFTISTPVINSLSKYENIIVSGNGYRYGDTSIKVKRKGLLTNYPWEIGEVGTNLSVPMSHSGQFSSGDIWMSYNGNSCGLDNVSDMSSYNGAAATNNFYLSTWNNTAMIQTGHSNGAATPDEQKIIANTLFYLAQVTEETSWDDHKGQDLTAPNAPAINSVSYDSASNSVNVSYMTATDNGSTYDYYIEATNLSTKDKIKSETKSATVTSGIKGYSVVVDNNPETIPSGEITSTGTTASVNLGSVNSREFYVHVSAVDNAGNVSEPVHYKYGTPVIELTPSTTELTYEPVKITAKATSVNTRIAYVQTPAGDWIEGDTAEYTVTSNGTYTFAAIDDETRIVTQSITISNIGEGGIIFNAEPEEKTATIGETVNVDLTIDNITEISAEDVRLRYDTSKLELLGIEEVEGIKIAKTQTGDGTIRIICASKGIDNVVFSKKILAKMQFKAIGEGIAVVEVMKGRVADGISMERNVLDNQCGYGMITIE